MVLLLRRQGREDNGLGWFAAPTETREGERAYVETGRKEGVVYQQWHRAGSRVRARSKTGDRTILRVQAAVQKEQRGQRWRWLGIDPL